MANDLETPGGGSLFKQLINGNVRYENHSNVFISMISRIKFKCENTKNFIFPFSLLKLPLHDLAEFRFSNKRDHV